jgi:hypothetical protein
MGKKIRQAAQYQPCTLRLEGCSFNPETTVFCHVKSPDNGMGLKQSKDFFGVFACHMCHDAMDDRRKTAMTPHLIYQAIIRGLYETQKILIEKELLSYDDG